MQSKKPMQLLRSLETSGSMHPFSSLWNANGAILGNRQEVGQPSLCVISDRRRKVFIFSVLEPAFPMGQNTEEIGVNGGVVTERIK